MVNDQDEETVIQDRERWINQKDSSCLCALIGLSHECTWSAIICERLVDIQMLMHLP